MLSNFRLAVRTLAKTPFVTAIAVLSLALGIGANTAIFSLFDRMLLRPLPVPDPGALVNLGTPRPKPGSNSCNQAGDCEWVFSYPMFRDLERVQTVVHRPGGALPDGRQPRGPRPDARAATAWPCRAATFRPSGSSRRPAGCSRPTTTGPPAPTPSSSSATPTGRRTSPRRADVVGSPITVNGTALTVIGVAPRGFEGTTLGTRPHVFVPLSMREVLLPGWKGLDNRRSYWAYVFGRLKPGVSLEQARAALEVPYRAIITDVEAPLQTGMSDQTMQLFKTKPLTVEPGARGQSEVRVEARAPLLLLLGVTALVLVTACANIANLLLARAAGRNVEMAVRLSIGASRWQVLGQLLVESCTLALLGGAAGLLVSRWTLSGIAALLPPEASATIPSGIDGSVLLYTLGLSLATGVVFGLYPALHSTRPDLVGVLKGHSGQPSGARAASRFRTGLATSQIALSMALLAAAGLFTKSLYNVSRVDLGTGHRSPGHLQRLAVAQRLFERADAGLLRTGGGRAGGAARRAVGHCLDDRPDLGQQLEQQHAGPGLRGRPRHQHHGLVQPGRPRLLPHPRHPAAAGTGLHPRRRRRRAQGGRGQPGLRPQVQPRRPRHRHAGRHRPRQPRALDIEIVGLVQDAKYSEVKGATPPQIFRPYRPAGRERRLDLRSTSTPPATPRRCSARPRPRSTRSTRTCRSTTPRPWPSRCARTSSSTG